MNSKRTLALVLGAVVAVPLLLLAEEKVDLSVVNRIKAEAFSDSKVMDTMFYLTDVYGPRLTNSPNYKAAGDWAVKRLQEYGLVNVKEEKWGPFGRGWANKYYEAHMVEPQPSPLIGVPLAWTQGTDGSVTGEPIIATIRTEADMDKYKGKLRGKIIMTSAPREMQFPTTAEGRRFTDAELLAESEAPEPGRVGLFGNPAAAARARAANQPAGPVLSREERMKLQEKIAQFMKDEGVLLVLSESNNGEGGTIFAASGGSYDPKVAPAIPAVGLMPEHYNRIARLVEHEIPVKLEFNIQNQFYDDNPDSLQYHGRDSGNRSA